jgi:RES domain-containing protein
VAEDRHRPRDLGLLDAVDALGREPLEADVWRLVRRGRYPTLGSPSRSRWCNGGFDILYTSLTRDGALAEIHALLSLQPVFPSKDAWFVHRLRVATTRVLRLADFTTLAALGVDVARYEDRQYARTQEIADAAYFLDFDGLIAPSARWSCLNLMLFTDRIAPSEIEIAESEETPVDWAAWRKTARR